ncbi:MAG: hypothetical protein QGH12_09240 [SAR324 cluster bacterium]|nr:hypothetical protein [SAR324 cluster bacterium]
MRSVHDGGMLQEIRKVVQHLRKDVGRIINLGLVIQKTTLERLRKFLHRMRYVLLKPITGVVTNERVILLDFLL